MGIGVQFPRTQAPRFLSVDKSALALQGFSEENSWKYQLAFQPKVWALGSGTPFGGIGLKGFWYTFASRTPD